MSIKHFANLSQKRLTEFLEHPERFTYQEKLDGSNFLVGSTDGKIWTSRKNGKDRYYSPDEWPKQPWANQFRIAHLLVDMVWKFYTGFTVLGDTIPDTLYECEILSTNRGNTVRYFDRHSYAWFDSIKLVIFNITLEDDKFDWLNRASAASSTVEIYTTNDGFTVIHSTTTCGMGIGELQTKNHILTPDLFEGLTLEEQEKVLLDTFVRGNQGDYQADQIEGVVFKHTTDNWLFKVVDRADFTARNKANNSFTSQLFRTPRRLSNSVADQLERDLSSGMNVSLAVNLARSRAHKVYADYLETLDLSIGFHRHMRNMEAMASFLTELEKNNGRKSIS